MAARRRGRGPTLFVDVGQQRSDQGITIILRRAYADSGSTILGYTVQLSPDLAQRYRQAMILSFDLTDQMGDEPTGTNIECAPPSAVGAVDCVVDASPFHLGSDATQVVITFSVHTMGLVNGQDANTPTVDGSWTFQFTIPYHQQSLGPGGPYAQPCGTANPCATPAG